MEDEPKPLTFEEASRVAKLVPGQSVGWEETIDGMRIFGRCWDGPGGMTCVPVGRKEP